MTNFVIYADDQTLSHAHDSARNTHGFKVSGRLEMATIGEIMSGEREIPMSVTKLRLTSNVKKVRTREMCDLMEHLKKTREGITIGWWHA